MKNLWLVIIVSLFSCQNEKPYLVDEIVYPGQCIPVGDYYRKIIGYDSVQYYTFMGQLKINFCFPNEFVTYNRKKLIDTVYIHDTIIDAVYKPKKYAKPKVVKTVYPIQTEWEDFDEVDWGEVDDSGRKIYPIYRHSYENDNEIEVISTDTSENPFHLGTKQHKDTLGGGQYYVSVINTPSGKEIEVNYSIESKMLIGWDGKHYVLCGVDDWGGCSVHIYHKTLREILDSAKQK